IDGEDARDFDDAVYAEPKRSGGWRLFVAIADVSHYVKPNSALDREALKRGNSVYFPSQVVPMLPEKLSNGLCSLNPQVDRLAMVCEMTISANGKSSSYRFYEAVFHSHARLTYTKVSHILER
ncbi:RNB domain-containing ribonuclease, partial [Bacillus pacificus]|nr:RNB domain-containing ribonuclease [Bacillus pacificus]